MDGKKLHVALLASPGMGHLIPILVLGNRLASHHHAKVTILVITTRSSAAETQVLKEKSKLVDILEIPPVDISSLVDTNTKITTQICIMVRESLPGIRSTLALMNPQPDLLIVDLFGTEVLPIATEFGIPKYVYVTSNAWFTALTVYCPVLDKEIVGEYVDQKEPLKIPGCKPVRPEDVVDPMLDRSDQQYREYLRKGMEFGSGDGILMNTWEDLEPVTLKAMRENEALKAMVKAPVYPVGPLRREPEPDRFKSEIKEWLDIQPNESVLYVSFGSGGSLPAEQIIELACGLEMSQQRFIWVVRPPPAKGSSDASFFITGRFSDGAPDFLPEGFLSRTKEVGLVIPEWAQQVEILRHTSVGGFLSHCGWNSCLESITNGVPFIAWPLYAEQRTNATLLTEELGVAVRPKVLPTKKVVDREEIEEMVRKVMQYKEGKVMRKKIKQLKTSGDKALSKEGSSFNSICNVLRDAKTKLKAPCSARII